MSKTTIKIFDEEKITHKGKNPDIKVKRQQENVNIKSNNFFLLVKSATAPIKGTIIPANNIETDITRPTWKGVPPFKVTNSGK